jgi:hypothetical protein
VAAPVKSKPSKLEKLAHLLSHKSQKLAGKFGGGSEHGGYSEHQVPVHAAPAHIVYRRDADPDEIEAGNSDRKLNAKEAYVLHKKSLEALKQQVCFYLLIF